MFGFGNKKQSCGLLIGETQARLVTIPASKQLKWFKKYSVSLPQGSVKNGKIMDEDAVSAALEALVQEEHLHKVKVNLTLPTSNVVIRKSVFPSLKDKELRNLIDVELYSGTQVPFKNPVFDFIRLGSVNREAAATAENFNHAVQTENMEEVIIVASPADVVDSFIRVVQRSGMEPVNVDIAPLAVYRLMRHVAIKSSQTLPDCFLLVHTESGQADVSIFVNGFPVFLRSIPVQSQTALDTGVDVVEAYCRNLHIELNRVLNYYKYSVSSGDKNVEQIIITGEDEWVNALQIHLNGLIHGEIRPLLINELFPDDDDNGRAFSIPLGLALKGAPV